MSICIRCPEGHAVTLSAAKLGTSVWCPHCLLPFQAEQKLEAGLNARPEKGKARPSRDDDDDDDEKPRKKTKPSQAKKKNDEDEEEEEEKPRAKKPARNRKQEEEDEDEEEEEEEEEEAAAKVEEEEPIVWTARKRQLSKVSLGLKFYQISLWALFAIFAVDALNMLMMIICLVCLLLEIQLTDLVFVFGILFNFLVLPALMLAFIGQLVAWILCFLAPAKAGTRVFVIFAILFFITPIFLYTIFLILWGTDFFRNELVSARFRGLMDTGVMLCGLLSFFMSLSILKELAVFMKMQQLARQPITLGWFIMGGIVVRAVCQAVLAASIFGSLRGLGLMTVVLALASAALTEGAYVFVLRSLFDLIQVVVKLKKSVDVYIKDG